MLWEPIKTLKIYYQTETSRGMSQHDFQFFENLMTFSLKFFSPKYALFILKKIRKKFKAKIKDST